MADRNKILVVDDSLIDQMITAKALQLNYPTGDVILMDSASNALAYLDQHCGDPDVMPFLIILDLDMPIINGLGFLEHFSCYEPTVTQDCKIIVLTGSEIESDLKKLQNHPCVSALLNKPLQRNSLAQILNLGSNHFPLSS